MTAAEALQSAVALLRQARQASDDGNDHLALQLATEATAWAQVAIAIETGVPAPGPATGGDQAAGPGL